MTREGLAVLALLRAEGQGGLSAEALVSEPDALSVRDAGSSERGEAGCDSQTDGFVCLTHAPQLAAAPAAPLGPPGGAESKVVTTEQELSGRTCSWCPPQQGHAPPGDRSGRGAMHGTGGLQRPHPHGRASTRRGSRSGRCRHCGSVAGSRAELRGEGRKGNVPPALRSGVTPRDR